MKPPFVPKAPRGRIPVTDEDRAAGRARMDGEKTKQANEPAAVAPTEPVASVATEPAAPTAALTQPAAPVASELVAIEASPDVATTPVAESAPDVASAAAAPVATEPTPEPAAVASEPDAPTVATAAPAQPTAVATAPAPTKPAPQPTATAAPGRRGRKPAVATGAAPVVLRSLKVPEGSWIEIKLVVAQLTSVEDVPHNIQTYIEAAHKHYEAHLRKQGKLPPK
jgi:hypothetical protein